MADDSTAPKDWWDKAEAVAKVVAAVGAVIGAVAIPWLINGYTEQSRNAQVLMQVMTEREKSDTDTRARMFERLIVNYLGEFKEYANKEDEQSFRKQIMILELLAVNFQEFFNARPLFEEVHRRLVAKKERAPTTAAWRAVENEIIRVSKNVAARQALTLNTLGKTVFVNIPVGHLYCLRMYDDAEMASLTPDDAKRLLNESYQDGPCSDLGSQIVDGRMENLAKLEMRRSIEIYVKQIDRVYSTAVVQVIPYDDAFTNGRYQYSRRRAGFDFEVSYFDLPYMDNTKLNDGSRLSLLLRSIYPGADRQDVVEIEAIRFRNDFVSLRDRPAFEDTVRRLNPGQPTSWWRFW